MPSASLMSSAGELAALTTALCWTASALAFESAARRIGALSVNLIRLALASVMLAVISAVWFDRALPLHVPAASAGWLIVSGLAGLVFGDFCLFRSFVLIGARRSTLVLTATPALAALLAWPALGERLGGRELLGMALTALGVMTAIFSRQIRSQLPDHRPALWPGVPLALGGALGQAGGLVLAKIGLAGVHPIAGTQVRLAAGVVGFALVIALTHRWRHLRSALDNRGPWAQPPWARSSGRRSASPCRCTRWRMRPPAWPRA